MIYKYNEPVMQSSYITYFSYLYNKLFIKESFISSKFLL